ncbi:MAG: hypothetical protein ACJ779_08580 [Chloroflexota bacterium]
MTDPTASDDPTESPTAKTPRSKPTATRTRTAKPGSAGSAQPAVTEPAPDALATETAHPVVVPPPIPENVTITNGGLDFAQATNVSVTQGGISRVEATSVDVRQGGIARADARDVTVTMGGIAVARADQVTTEMGGIGLSVAGEARVSQSFVRTMFAKDVQVDQGAVWSLAAGRVTFKRRGFAGVVIAGRVDGDVRTLLDWRGALAVGGVAAVLLAIARRR